MFNIKYIKFYVAIFLSGAYIVMPDVFLDHYLAISLFLFAGIVVDIARGFGNRILPLDLMSFYAITVYLTSTALFYYLNEMELYIGFAKMSVDKEEYFRFAFPGTLALLAGLQFPFAHIHDNHKEYYKTVTQYLKERTQAGIYLFWIGLFSHLMAPFVSGMLSFIMELSTQLIYIGGLYIWFAPSLKNKWFYITAMFIFPVFRALQAGMFGELVFWSVFLLMFMLLKYKVPFYRKISLAVLGIALMFFIQSIKQEYRQMTWFQESARAQTLSYKLNVFQKLWDARLNNPDLVFGPLMMSSALERTNQGMLVSMAMQHVPDNEPFCKGETIILATLGSFVPRFLWPDKPEVGSRNKMIRFTGFDPGEVTAMDIGQLGDAYVNFGIRGGVVFMFVYGFVFAWILSRLFSIGIGGVASVIIWIPLFYVGVVKMEGSVLETSNHIIKSLMFAWFVYFSFDNLGDIKL